MPSAFATWRPATRTSSTTVNALVESTRASCHVVVVVVVVVVLVTVIVALDWSVMSSCVWLGYVNSALNPIIYTIFNDYTNTCRIVKITTTTATTRLPLYHLQR